MVKLNCEFLSKFVSEKEISDISAEVASAYEALKTGTGAGSDFTGWLDLPESAGGETIRRIKNTAKKIRDKCDVFVVIGIGGSYLGSRAVIEYIQSETHNELRGDGPAIYFAGNGLSPSYLNNLLRLCDGKDVCVNVISRSGGTLEPAVSFRIFHELLEKKYSSSNLSDRIFVTTVKEGGALNKIADEGGFEKFVIPDDVGGRYSVLTPAGLLPAAVAGVDIDELVSGALEAKKAFSDPDPSRNDCFKYAAVRNILLRRGKPVEILAGYEPYMRMFCEWWKQLFAESEGKDHKGIFPASVIFSTDLHSMGQYIQDGTRNIFETVISVKEEDSRREVPEFANNADGLDFISGKTLSYINETARIATMMAHSEGGVPNILVETERRDERNLGALMYFFELACGISGYLLGVNPFNQPGVEAYKKNMFALLRKK